MPVHFTCPRRTHAPDKHLHCFDCRFRHIFWLLHSSAGILQARLSASDVCGHLFPCHVSHCISCVPCISYITVMIKGTVFADRVACADVPEKLCSPRAEPFLVPDQENGPAQLVFLRPGGTTMISEVIPHSSILGTTLTQRIGCSRYSLSSYRDHRISYAQPAADA